MKFDVGVMHKPRGQFLGLFQPPSPLRGQFYYIDFISKVDILQTPLPHGCPRGLCMPPNVLCYGAPSPWVAISCGKFANTQCSKNVNIVLITNVVKSVSI